jgi:hypothetical protein
MERSADPPALRGGPPFSFAGLRTTAESQLRDQLREIRENLAVVKHYAQINNCMMEALMAVADDLKAEVAAVKSSVDGAMTLIDKLRSEGGTVTDAEVASAMADLKASRDALDAKVNPPAPTA